MGCVKFSTRSRWSAWSFSERVKLAPGIAADEMPAADFKAGSDPHTARFMIDGLEEERMLPT
jgi:hypothetical protein